jgi:hypothetical protein
MSVLLPETTFPRKVKKKGVMELFWEKYSDSFTIKKMELFFISGWKK